MNHKYQTTKHTNTTQITKTTTSTWVSPLTQILCSYIWDNANSEVFILKLCNKLTNFVHFIHHQFVQFIDPEKHVRGLMTNFVHFIHHQLVQFIDPEKPVRGLMNNFVHFIHHQFAQFIDPETPVRGLINKFVHFIHPYMNLLPAAWYKSTCSTFN